MITLSQLKNYLRYEDADTSQDSALGVILGGAQRWVENYTGHVMTQRAITETPPLTGDYHDLRFRPYVADSLTLTYLDSDGQEADTFEAFKVFQVHGVWRVKPDSAWPTTTGGYTLSYMAGYEDVYDVPEDLLLAVALHAGMTDQERGDQTAQGWKAIYKLLEQYRMPVLA